MKVAVFGAGTMGSGIAQVFAAKGHTALMYASSVASAQRHKDKLAASLQKRVEKGKMTEEAKDAILNNILVEEKSAAADADLVIECVAENMDTKRQLLGELDEMCKESAVFATNTSSLSVTEMGLGLKHAVIGMHFFNPVPSMKLVEVIRGDLHGYLDEQALELVKDGTHMFTFPNLNLVESSEESKMLNMDTTPKVIISASGMCDAGRIRHHLKHNLWRANSAVVFVGFQSPGTLGRRLLDGVEKVKLFGEEIAVKAKIVNFQGLSSHADHDHLVQWIKAFDPKPTHVFVVHGDEDVAPVFAEELNSLGFHAHAAKFTECYDLAANEMVSEGYVSERKRTAQKSRADNLYAKLVAAAESLLEFAKRCKGRPNKDISALTGQIISLIERFRE